MLIFEVIEDLNFCSAGNSDSHPWRLGPSSLFFNVRLCAHVRLNSACGNCEEPVLSTMAESCPPPNAYVKV